MDLVIEVWSPMNQEFLSRPISLNSFCCASGIFIDACRSLNSLKCLCLPFYKNGLLVEASAEFYNRLPSSTPSSHQTFDCIFNRSSLQQVSIHSIHLHSIHLHSILSGESLLVLCKMIPAQSSPSVDPHFLRSSARLPRRTCR